MMTLLAKLKVMKRSVEVACLFIGSWMILEMMLANLLWTWVSFHKSKSVTPNRRKHFTASLFPGQAQAVRLASCIRPVGSRRSSKIPALQRPRMLQLFSRLEALEIFLVEMGTSSLSSRYWWRRWVNVARHKLEM